MRDSSGVERRLEEPRVDGSIPSPSTTGVALNNVRAAALEELTSSPTRSHRLARLRHWLVKPATRVQIPLRPPRGEAQLDVHRSPKPGATGSRPVTSAMPSSSVGQSSVLIRHWSVVQIHPWQPGGEAY